MKNMKNAIIVALLTAALWVAPNLFTAEPSGAKGTAVSSVSTQPVSAPTNRTPDVIFVPTPQDTVDKMLELAEIKPGDTLYDLGCGDGRIVVTAAKKYGVKATGFDIDPKRVEESLENVRTNNVGHLVTIKQADIFTLDLRPANVVTLYLLPSLNVKLIPQLDRLENGSRVLSHSFDMAGVKPVNVKQDGVHTIYKWVTPLQKEKN
jgi:SAM-dependent methyltransferase